MKRVTAVFTMVCLWASMIAATGCTAISVAQDIVNWTPVVVSTVSTLGTVVSGLAPADQLIITGVTAGFDAAANLLQQQAQAYLANPTKTVLGTLQAQVLAFQQNVNAALLAALKVSDSSSQKLVLQAIQAVATGLTAIIALITTIKGNTVSKAAVVSPVKISQVEKFLDRQQSIRMVAAHYGESNEAAALQVDWAQQRLVQAGL